MNLVLPLYNVSLTNIQFLETKDNIRMNGIFTKLIYSDFFMTMNGLYAIIPIALKSVNYHFGYFNPIENITWIRDIIAIESHILQEYRRKNKSRHLRFSSIQTVLQSGTIKLSSYATDVWKEHSMPITCLKISGVWENNGTIGITYKFLYGR